MESSNSKRPPLRTLLVEDDPVYRGMVADLLLNQFPTIVVVQAGDVDSAMMQIHESRPDVILTDLQLPGVNGLTLTRSIKKLDPHILVVVLSNYDLPEYRQAAFRAGADCYISKGSDSCRGDILAQIEGAMTEAIRCA